MRRLKHGFVILILFFCCYAEVLGRNGPEQGSTIGISMSSGIIKQQTELSIGHAFAINWSVNWKVSAALSLFTEALDDEEKKHYGEFIDLTQKYAREMKETMQCCASVTYWPAECHKGAYFRCGATIGNRHKADIESSIGYFFRIYRGIYADIAYEMEMISSFVNEDTSNNGINIRVHLRF